MPELPDLGWSAIDRLTPQFGGPLRTRQSGDDGSAIGRPRRSLNVGRLGTGFNRRALRRRPKLTRRGRSSPGLQAAHGVHHVRFDRAYIDDTRLPAEAFDAVISNGVINLASDETAVFREVARVLVPGGRLALSDIVTERPLPPTVTCNATLWAACIGGAMQIDDYADAIESVGVWVRAMSANHAYRFQSRRAMGASTTYGVRSISLVATRR